MRTKPILLSLGLLCLSLSAFGQREETLFGERGLRLSGFWASWNHQLTSINNTNSYMSGWQFNLEFSRSLLLGYGNYYLQDDVKWDQIQDQPFKMKFHAFKVGYGLKTFRAIHPLVSVDFGPGKLTLADVNDRVFIVQPSAGVEINLLRWARLGLEGGYRFVTDSSMPGLSDERMSGYFGQASLRFGISWDHEVKRQGDGDHDD